jgi:hypothetical protein
MNKSIYSLVCIILLVWLKSDLYGFDSKELSVNPGSAEVNVFQTGRSLMVGETFTNPLKMSSVDVFPKTPVMDPIKPIDLGRSLTQASQWKGYTAQDFGIDVSKINPRVTDNKVIKDN